MGTIFAAVNHKTKEAYYLDKGDWMELEAEVHQCRPLILRVCLALGIKRRSDEEYAQRVTKDLDKYWPFSIVSEHEFLDQEKYKDYTITGSRFPNCTYIGCNLYDPFPFE